MQPSARRSAQPLGGFELSQILAIAFLPALALLAVLFGVSLEPKRLAAFGIAGAVGVPLAALSIYSYLAYRMPTISLGHSLVPQVTAAAASAVLAGIVLWRTSGRWQSKLLIAALATASWTGLWLASSLVVACSSGDCL
jgi:hypothetical protein